MRSDLILLIFSFGFIVQFLISYVFKVSVPKKIFKLFAVSLVLDTIIAILFVLILSNNESMAIKQGFSYVILLGSIAFINTYLVILDVGNTISKKIFIGLFLVLSSFLVFAGKIIGPAFFVILTLVQIFFEIFGALYKRKFISRRVKTLTFVLIFTEIMRYIMINMVLYQILFGFVNEYIWLVAINYNMRAIVVLLVSKLLEYVSINENLVKAFDDQSPAELLNLAFEKNPNVIVLTDVNEKIIYVNPASLMLTGYNEHEIIGTTPRIFASGHTKKKVYNELKDALANNEDWTGEFINKKKNGDIFIELAKIVPLRDINDNPIFYLGIKTDVTKERIYLEKLERSSNYDGLTGLLQRNKFLNMVEEKRKEIKNNESFFILIDIDEFKSINDEYGHFIGDYALIHFSEILQSTLDNYAYVCRFGGDEFAVFIYGASKELTLRLFDDIHEKLAKHPYVSKDNKELYMKVSIGIVEYKSDYAFNEVYVLADKCLYQAKALKSDRNTITNF